MGANLVKLVGLLNGDGGRMTIALVIVAMMYMQVEKLAVVVEENSAGFRALHELILERTSDRYTSSMANEDWRLQQKINSNLINKLNDHEIRIRFLEVGVTGNVEQDKEFADDTEGSG